MLPQGKPWTQALVVMGHGKADRLWWKQDTGIRLRERKKGVADRNLAWRPGSSGIAEGASAVNFAWGRGPAGTEHLQIVILHALRDAAP